MLHTLWWDSRNDPAYSPARPVETSRADGTVVPSLEVFASTSTDGGASWTTAVRVTDVTTNPNYEQFDNRQVPFAGDYLWIDAQHGKTFRHLDGLAQHGRRQRSTRAGIRRYRRGRPSVPDASIRRLMGT